MALSPSELIWRDHIEKLGEEKQKELLRWQLQAREPIHRFADVRIGDHLVVKRSLGKGLIPYEHHFLCIKKEKDKPTIIHYYNTPWNAFKQSLALKCSSLEDFAFVQEMTLPNNDFIKNEKDLQAEGNEVARVVWPEEMRRYSNEEVIQRAKQRKEQKWYNVVENNCETFVMWCLCGLEVSTQVTRKIHVLCEVGSSLVHTARQAVQYFMKAVVDFTKVRIDYLDEVLALVSPKFTEAVLPKGAGLALGALVSICAETHIAYRDISDAKAKWGEEVVIKTKAEFIKAVIDSVVSAPFNVFGSVAGMVLGPVVFPFPLGGLLGTLVGYLFGRGSAKLLTEFGFTEWLADCIAGCIQWIEARSTREKIL